MSNFALFLNVGPSLGRVDYGSLSDQTLMEMLIEGFDEETKRKYQDEHGIYSDVCEWPGITCDLDDRVVEIQIKTRHVIGSLELCYVPPEVKLVRINSRGGSKMTGSVDLTRLPKRMNLLILNNNRLTGKIDLTRLPPVMECLNLSLNQLTGEIDLTHLPDGMVFLSLEGNQLTGEIHLTQLPDGMKSLSLYKNQLTGEIDLTRLPPVMKYLDLSLNQLTGSVDLIKLPWKMQDLLLNNNRLSGSFVITRVPTWMEVIHAGGNRFNAIAVVDSEARASIRLRGSGVTSVVDANGRERDMRKFLM